MKTNNRFSKKCDKIFWLIVMLLPIAIFLVTNFRNGAAESFWVFMENFGIFNFISDILDNVSSTAFGTEFQITKYLSYVVGVEIFHCLFDVIVFIPRLAHKWISKAVQDE